MTNPFKQRDLARVYDVMLALARNPESELYHEGKPRRGASHRCAFWDGFNGLRPGYIPRGTMAWACLRAGEAWAKQQAKDAQLLYKLRETKKTLVANGLQRQIQEARRSFKRWPKWMRDAAYFATT